MPLILSATPIPGDEPGALLFVLVMLLIIIIVTAIAERVERWAGPR